MFYVMLTEVMKQNKTRSLSDLVRCFGTSSRLSKSHYDELEVPPSASQTEIKSAYYRLSKIHHPDKSNDDTSAKKFRAITQAYEVLGNVKLKKMYDRGLLGGIINRSQTVNEQPTEPLDPTLKFYESRNNRRIIPTMDGKKVLYNMDAWSKAHYGETFKKSQYEKDFLKKAKQKEEMYKREDNHEIYLFYFLGVLLILVTFINKSDYDIIKEVYKEDKQDDKQGQEKSENNTK